MKAAVVVTLFFLAGCDPRMKTDPLITASCPPLTPITDPSFGATTLKLIETAGQYNVCRCAALPKECSK